VFDSWVGDLTDKVTAGVVEKLWMLFQAILHGIGWGTILIGIGLLLGLILIVKLLSNIRVLLVLVPLCLLAGYCMTKGIDLDSIYRYVAGGDDACVEVSNSK
jgi:hypothetical protein